MRPNFSFLKKKSAKPWELLATAVLAGIGIGLIQRHWHHRHKVVYLGGSVLGLAAAGILGFQSLPSATTDVLHIAAISCNDGTADGQCVYARTGSDTDKPKKCVSGQIKDDNKACGCPAGYYPWLDGSCTHLPQLKTFNQFLPYCMGITPGNADYNPNCPSQNDTTWAAEHFDITGAFTHQKPLIKQAAPLTKIWSYVNMQTLTPEQVKVGLPAYCAAHGCTNQEGTMLHYIEDTAKPTRTQGTICVPGYNPAARPSGWNPANPGCTANDSFARATSTAAARVPDGYLPGWRWVNLRSTDWQNYMNNTATSIISAGGVESDYLFSDIADFKPMNSTLEFSEIYAGLPTDIGHADSYPRVQEVFDKQTQLRTYVSNYFGKTKELIPNLIDPASYLVYPWLTTRYQTMNALNYFEIWEIYENAVGAPSGGVGRAYYYADYLRSQEILRQSLQNNTRFILKGSNYASSELPRARRYLTAYFYLLNNKNLTYGFYDATSEQGGAGQNPGSNITSITQHAWAPIMNYNIGRPVAIPAGKTDVFGAAASTGTTEHYLLDSGVDPSTTNDSRVYSSSCKNAQGHAIPKNYYVYARNYSKALVLVKFRDYCGFTDASSNTNVALGGSYYILQDDGTVGASPVSTVTLKNNDAVILIPASVVSSCPENWTCSDWTSCSANKQNRQCWDLNTCGTTVNMPAVQQSCSASSCTESWTCTNWSSCTGNQQTRTCTEVNHCGTSANKPTTSQSCSPLPACTESWTCGSWSACAGSQQTRNCTDANACGSTATRPLLTQSCNSACVPNVLCNDWSGCSDGKQTRTCSDTNRCSAGTNNETRTCVENVPDTIAPETNSVTVATVITQNWLSLALGGKDNQSASAKLRFNFSLNGGSKQLLTGTTLKLRNLANGPQKLTISAIDEANNEDSSPLTLQFTVKNTERIITIPSSGGPSLVRVFDYQGQLLSQFQAFSPFQRNGGSLALIDSNNDGQEEIAVAPGRGGKPEVKFFDQSGKSLGSFMAYPENFRGGVNLAAADLDGDGTEELITAPASGTGPLLRVFKSTGEIIAEVSAFDRTFRGGVNITAGLLDNSGKAIVVAAPASNSQPLVSIFALEGGQLVLKTTKQIATASQPTGVSLSINSVSGFEPQIIASLTEGGQSAKVYVLSGNLSVLKEFSAGDQSFTGGLRVASGDIDNFDNLAEVAVSMYSGARQKIQIFSPGSDLSRTSATRSFNPYGWSRFGINMVIGSWK